MTEQLNGLNQEHQVWPLDMDVIADVFTPERLMMQEGAVLDINALRRKLKQNPGAKVYSVSVGGTNTHSTQFTVGENGYLIPGQVNTIPTSPDVVELIKTTANMGFTSVANAGPVFPDGRVVGTNWGYRGNLIGETGCKVVNNDAASGTTSALFFDPYPTICQVVGTGQGLTVAKETNQEGVFQLVTSEGGHVDGSDLFTLLPGVNGRLCKIFPESRQCAEQIIAAPGGVAAYNSLCPDSTVRDGLELTQKAQGGDKTAMKVLDVSAHGAARAFLGLANATDQLGNDDLHLFGQGSVWKTPWYKNIVRQNLSQSGYPQLADNLIIEKNIMPNGVDAALYGAGLLGFNEMLE